MTTGLESTDGYRNEPMALAAHPAAEFRVQIRHADAEATDSYLVLFEREALDPEPANDPGEADEDLPDDAFVREKRGFFIDRIETEEHGRPRS